MYTSFLSYKRLPKALPVGLLIALSMPTHSAMIDTPNVRDGLSFGIFTNINPEFTYTSNKFNYVLGDPRIYGQTGTIAQVLADKDRQDADKRLRADGVHDGSIQLIARQVLTKDLTLEASGLLAYDKNSHRNYGALWGVGLEIDKFGEISIGDAWTRLPVRQTDVDNIIQNRGTNIAVEYTGIPDLTVAGYHMFTSSEDVDDPRQSGWHKSHGLAVKYEFDFAPKNKLTVAVGGTLSKGHDNPFFVDTASKGESYMGSIGYHYNDLNIAFDYGESKNKYNGAWADNINTKVYGVKASYNITPRLKGTISYAHKDYDNTKPIGIDFFLARPNIFDVNNLPGFPIFDKVKQDRYKTSLDYQLYHGIKLTGSVEKQITTNYVTEGKFSERNRLHASVGASFSF